MFPGSSVQKYVIQNKNQSNQDKQTLDRIWNGQLWTHSNTYGNRFSNRVSGRPK